MISSDWKPSPFKAYSSVKIIIPKAPLQLINGCVSCARKKPCPAQCMVSTCFNTNKTKMVVLFLYQHTMFGHFAGALPHLWIKLLMTKVRALLNPLPNSLLSW